MSMARIGVSEDFATGAEVVWKELSDFGGLDRWMPGVERCEVEGEGVGALRTVAMGPVKVVERLDSFDDAGRRLSYALLEGPMPLRDFVGSIEVTETGAGSCRVDWSARFELPEGVGEEQVAPGIEGGYGGALKALKVRLGA